MKITHRQIEVFRTVMQTGHVTRAAERLRTSQPTVSRELARLEQVTGLRLFDRVRGRLHPTARAHALMEEVELSYVGLERIAATAGSLRSWAQGRLQVACLPALAHALLPAALRLLAHQVPDAAVGLTPLDSPQLESALSDQRHDLGLSERQEPPPACSLHPLLVADEVAVLPEGSPLAGHRVLSAQDFEGQPFVSLAAGDPYRHQVDEWFARAGVSRRLNLEAASAVSVCALVAQGLGLGIVNPLTALAMRGQGLLVKPLSVSIEFRVSVIRPAWRAVHPLRAPLEDALKATAEALLRDLP
ncbi:MAG: LysR family transcriptional regulator [Burkholderiales bacterium]|nr:MAG: LysR family transcriptional regulator [Burkholderiales bacterium]